jgi:hypothetical protein
MSPLRLRYAVATFATLILATANSVADAPRVGVAEPARVGVAEPPRDTGATLPHGTFLADDGLRSFRETYDAGARPRRRERHYLRAVLEEGAVLGVGTAYYWIRPEINKTDWDFPDYATRMSNLRPTFDTNLHVTNNVLHPLAGSFYYGFARLNGLSIPESIGYSFATSAVFEFFLEWLEKASVNDLIMTPMGGFAPGEFFLHLGDYFNSAPRADGWLRKASGLAFGLPHRLHGGESFTPGAHRLPPDALGYSSYYTHRFDLLLGAGRAVNDAGSVGQTLELRVEARMIAMPGFLRPGRFSTGFGDGNFTDARFHAAVGNGLGESFDLFFDANLAGRYAQNVAVVDGQREGRASMIALDTSMRFADRRFGHRYDGYAMAHLLGPAFKLWSVHGEFTARLEGATHPDFATMFSPAFLEWRRRYGDAGVKSSLQQKDLYYGYGWSGRLEGAVGYGRFELGSRAFLGAYGSIDRWDRFQDRVTRKTHLEDRITELEAWVGWSVPRLPVHLRVYTQHFGHDSRLEPVRWTRWDRRVGLLFGTTL